MPAEVPFFFRAPAELLTKGRVSNKTRKAIGRSLKDTTAVLREVRKNQRETVKITTDAVADLGAAAKKTGLLPNPNVAFLSIGAIAIGVAAVAGVVLAWRAGLI